jgi:hypothetical protein
MINIKFTRAQYNALREALAMVEHNKNFSSPFAPSVSNIIKKKMQQAFKDNNLESPYDD